MAPQPRHQPVVLPQAQWMPDTATQECISCRTSFSCWNRRHHCRACGIVVCNACSASRMTFDGEAAPLRVCDGCHKQLSEELKPASEATTSSCCGGCHQTEDAVAPSLQEAHDSGVLQPPVAIASQQFKPTPQDKQDAGAVSMVVVAPVAKKAVMPVMPAEPQPAPAVVQKEEVAVAEEQVVLTEKHADVSVLAAEPPQPQADEQAAGPDPAEAVGSQAPASVEKAAVRAEADNQDEDPGQDAEDEADAPSGGKAGKKKRGGRKGNKGKGKAAGEAGRKEQAKVAGAF